MWGIGFKKKIRVDGEYLDVKDKIYQEKNTVKKYVMIFGLGIQIWEKEFESDITLPEKSEGLGFKK